MAKIGDAADARGGTSSCRIARVSSSDRSRVFVAFAVSTIALAAAWLRFDRLGGPSLWLDEILNVKILRWMKPLPPWKWIVGFDRENGPLYFAIYGAGLHLSKSLEWAFRFPSAVAGVASVVLIVLLARHATSEHSTSIVAAALLAISPLHVYYSREGRPYALLVLFSIAAALALIGRDGRSRPALLAAVAFLAAATAATSAPLLASITVVAVVDAFLHRASRRDSMLVAGGTIAAVVYTAILYGRFDHPKAPAGFGKEYVATGAVIVNGYSVTGREAAQLAPLALVAVLLALVGFARMHDRRSARILAGLAFLPPVVTLASLVLANHWLSLRYAIHGLGPFLVLLAAGIVETASLVSNAAPRWRTAVRALVVAAIATPLVVAGVRAATTEPYERTGWRHLANLLARYTTPDDVVIASGGWPGISYYFYMKEIGHQLSFRDGKESLAVVRSFAEKDRAKWLVVGGFTRDDEIRAWACDSFAFARDEFESVRLYYLPGVAEFVRERGTRKDRERYVATAEVSRHGRFTAADSALFVGGWYDAERAGSETFRWSRRESSFLLPVPAGTVRLRFDANPFVDPRRRQQLDVLVDGHPVASLALADSPVTYEVPLGTFDSPHVAEITFRFAWEMSPAELNGSGDRRQLSASLTTFEIVAPSPRGGSAPPVLFSVDTPVPRAVAKEKDCRVAIAWTAAARRSMLARLGMDASARYDIDTTGSLANLVVDALPPRECLSDGAFLEAIYPLLLDRPVDRTGKTYYAAGLASGWSRERVVCAIARETEFRDVLPVR